MYNFLLIIEKVIFQVELGTEIYYFCSMLAGFCFYFLPNLFLPFKMVKYISHEPSK